MDSAELAEWRAYYRIEPFGELIADQRHGVMSALTANINRDSKRRPQAYKPADFIEWRVPPPVPPPRPLTPAEHSAQIVGALFGRLRGRP